MSSRPRLIRTVLCASIVAPSYLLAATASAADTQPVSTPGPPQPMTGDEAAPVLEEVIVTSQKRAENILSVPISITAVSQATLEQEDVKDINDLSRLVPGVSLIPTGQSTTNSAQSTGERTVVIRGIAATAGSATTGIYIDDTPIQAREAGTVYPEVFDLERVEVLRGPQGTLFGAGSEGGTVRFITPTPSLTNLNVYGHSEVAFTQGGTPSFEAGVGKTRVRSPAPTGTRRSVQYPCSHAPSGLRCPTITRVPPRGHQSYRAPAP